MYHCLIIISVDASVLVVMLNTLKYNKKLRIKPIMFNIEIPKEILKMKFDYLIQYSM
jgi:hypothetical protein